MKMSLCAMFASSDVRPDVGTRTTLQHVWSSTLTIGRC